MHLRKGGQGGREKARRDLGVAMGCALRARETSCGALRRGPTFLGQPWYDLARSQAELLASELAAHRDATLATEQLREAERRLREMASECEGLRRQAKQVRRSLLRSL